MFVEAGFCVDLLCWDRGREYPRFEQREGYRIRRCHIPAPYASKWLFVMMPLWWVYAFFQLLCRRYDASHACDFDTVAPALAARVLRRKPVV